MAIPNKKTDAAKIFSTPILFENPPPVPSAYSKSALEQYSADHGGWWEKTRTTLTEMGSRIVTLEAAVNDLTPSPTSTTIPAKVII